MPIYEFECAKCGKESEVLVRSSRWQGTRCPHCGSSRITKKLSVFASSQASTQSSEPVSCCMGKGGGGCGCSCGGGGGHKH